jgi:nucleotide-binding universal stress UspA family protein
MTFVQDSTRRKSKTMIGFKRILVPLDGSPLSERALPVAMALAEKFESLIILLRAWELSVPSVPALDPAVGARVTELQEHMYEEAERYLETQADKVRQQGLNVQAVLSDVAPADGIIRTATTEDVDLIVMSTHGRGGFARWAFGSVADKVARHSHCPVLLVRHTPESADEA